MSNIFEIQYVHVDHVYHDVYHDVYHVNHDVYHVYHILYIMMYIMYIIIYVMSCKFKTKVYIILLYEHSKSFWKDFPESETKDTSISHKKHIDPEQKTYNHKKATAWKTLPTHVMQNKIFASNIQAPGAIVEFVEHQRLDPLVLIDIAVKVLREQNICLFRLNVCHDNI